MFRITVIAVSFFLLNTLSAQNFQNIRDIQPAEDYENIWSKEIYSDSLTSTYMIYIKKGVKLHKHEWHTENVYVISGTGDMKLGEERLSIVAGDIITIPQNTPHSLVVTSRDPVSIISVQSPEFKGKDRVFLE